ncbi:MAG: conjugal transfer protein TraX [Ruminococcaceae bacterium]|nr:conjugal transfer protein TraX [Oscillospiraceae bacterium]
MKKLPANSPLVKIPFGGLTSNMLRILAMAFMICDHLWAKVVPGNDWMTYVGRMTFPIFAFMISEGFIHTSNLKKYISRLLVFALISEIPFNLFYGGSWFYPYHQNVMFTLLFGLLAIMLIDKARKNKDAKTIVKSALLVILLGIASFIGFVDYGFWGFLIVIMFYLFRDFPFAWLAQLAAMIIINCELFEGQFIIVDLFGKSFEFATQGFAVFSLIPIWLYGGRKGKSSKIMQYGFYAFYPLHMIIIYLAVYFA